MVQLENQYLRPKKAAALERWHQDPFEIREDLKVWRGENATILPLRREPDSGLLFGKGGVVDKDGNYVNLSSIPGRVQCVLRLSGAPLGTFSCGRRVQIVVLPGKRHAH